MIGHKSQKQRKRDIGNARYIKNDNDCVVVKDKEIKRKVVSYFLSFT